MKRIFTIILLVGFCLFSCGTLQPVSMTKSQEDSLDNYKYFYVNPTGVKTGSAGYVVGNQYGVYGGSSTKSTDPCDIISGYLIKRNLIRVAEIDDNIKGETVVVSYGETGRRTMGLGYAIEVTIQFSSAKTHSVVCTVTGEGRGDTEADDIRLAITRCLDMVFGVVKQEKEESFY